MTQQPTVTSVPLDAFSRDLASRPVRELLQIYGRVLDELKRRSIVRTLNSPVADYTEWLVADRLGLTLTESSKAGCDAIGGDGTRYQIKGRRVTASATSAQLSALRRLADRPFDVLVAVVFEPDFAIRHGLLIPIEVVLEKSRFQAHTNSHIFHVRPSLLEDRRITDIGRRLGPREKREAV